MSRRGISNETVHQVVESPEQEYEVRPGRKVFQARLVRGVPPRVYLYRVFADSHGLPDEQGR